MAHGKHRKPEEHNYRAAAVITTGALSLAGIAAFGGTAHAAPVSAWDKIADCESGNWLPGGGFEPNSADWQMPNGDGGASYGGGGLQFQPASWRDALAQLRSDGVDTSAFGEYAYQSTKNQQILAAEALLKLQGPDAWACNSLTGGALNGYAGGDYGPYLGGDSLPPAGDVEPVPGDSHPSARGDHHGHGWGHHEGRHDRCSHPAEDAPATPPADAEGTHTVVPGDTLYDITKAGTGDASLDNWKPLYEANKAVVGDNPDLIFPGQVLTLPWASGGSDAPAEEPPAADPVDPAPADPEGSPTASVVAPLDGIGPSSNGYGAAGSSYTLGYHTGQDFPAPEGTPVHSVSAGEVVASDTSSAYGINVQIKNADGTYALYAHLSAADVAPGDSVTAGQVIGKVGNTGTNSTGSHLHLEIRTAPQFAAGNFLDPIAWLAGKGVTF